MIIIIICEFLVLSPIAVNKTSLLVDQLYRSHQSWLHQWLRQKLGNTDQAADLVQDTFIKLLQTRDELFGIKEPRAYLTSIAKTCWLTKCAVNALNKPI